MVVVDTHFKIKNNSQIASFISGRTFRNDNEFLEVLEDYLFGQMIEESDVGDFVEESVVLETLSSNLGK